MLPAAHRSHGIARALLSLSLVTIVGCIWVVDPADSGDRCLFRGRDTDCGRCIVQRCQKQVDACCGDTSCGGVIRSVEGCAEAGDERCDDVHAAATGIEDQRKALATCVTAMCRGACERAPTTSSSRCGETRFSLGTTCACQPATNELPANRYQCTSSIFPSSRCCASLGWPSAGNQCSCLAVACSPSRDGCSCSLVEAYSPNTTTRCAGDHCCQGDRACHCGAEPCGANELAVSECTASTAPCGELAVAVEGCSLP